MKSTLEQIAWEITACAFACHLIYHITPCHATPDHIKVKHRHVMLSRSFLGHRYISSMYYMPDLSPNEWEVPLSSDDSEEMINELIWVGDYWQSEFVRGLMSLACGTGAVCVYAVHCVKCINRPVHVMQ